MTIAAARSYEAMAAEGRTRSRYICRDGGTADVIAAKQPLRAERRPAGPMAWRITSTDPFRDPWVAGRPLRITVASDALREAPEPCNQLLALAKSDNLVIDLSPFGPADDRSATDRLSYEHHDGPYWLLRSAREPTKTRGLTAAPELLDAIAGLTVDFGGGSTDVARELVLDLCAHRDLAGKHDGDAVDRLGEGAALSAVPSS